MTTSIQGHVILGYFIKGEPKDKILANELHEAVYNEDISISTYGWPIYYIGTIIDTIELSHGPYALETVDQKVCQSFGHISILIEKVQNDKELFLMKYPLLKDLFDRLDTYIIWDSY